MFNASKYHLARESAATDSFLITSLLVFISFKFEESPKKKEAPVKNTRRN